MWVFVRIVILSRKQMTLLIHISVILLLSFQAELYRVKRAFDKAEPLYLEAIGILEESFGPDDIR